MLMKYWWNHGVNQKCLSTYCYLVQDIIPMSGKSNTKHVTYQYIHNMLQCIPSIAEDNLHSYFDSISNKLQLYNTLKDIPALLELVMWKLMIISNFENDISDILSADKKQCPDKLLLTVRKIVPLVLTFLTADDYTYLWETSWKCYQCIYMNDEDISNAVFGDTNEGSKICVMCSAERQH